MTCHRIAMGRRAAVICIPEQPPPPRERPDVVNEGCGPNRRGMMDWWEWAEAMDRTHRTVKCPECGRPHIWVRRGKAAEARHGYPIRREGRS